MITNVSHTNSHHFLVAEPPSGCPFPGGKQRGDPWLDQPCPSIGLGGWGTVIRDKCDRRVPLAAGRRPVCFGVTCRRLLQLVGQVGLAPSLLEARCNWGGTASHLAPSPAYSPGARQPPASVQIDRRPLLRPMSSLTSPHCPPQALLPPWLQGRDTARSHGC